MEINHRQATFLFAMFVSIYLFSGWLQSNLICGWDVSWGLHLANCLLNGGTYGKDYVEINPPMFIYLYVFPALLVKYFAISNMLALEIYLFLLSTGSLLICLHLAKSIFLIQDAMTYCFFMVAIAAVYLLLPIPSLNFGQREHLLILLIMPYLLLICCRLKQKKITPITALCIGALAGLGFAIKPYFLITFVLVELYYCFHQQKLAALIRIESLAIISVLVIYLLSVLVFFRSYLTDMLPLVMRYYYQGYGAPWSKVILKLPVIFSLVVAMVGLIQLLRKTYFTLCTLLLVVLLGLLAAYFLQKTGFIYHSYPAYSIAIILSTLYFCLFLSQAKSSYLAIMLSCSQGLLVLFILCCHAYGQYQFAINYKMNINPIITFLHNHAWQQRVYFFSTAVFDEFPAIDYAGAIPSSRYGMLFWIPAMQKQLPMSEQSRLQFKNDAITFVDTIADEINTNKPVLIVVQKNNFRIDKPIDFVSLFLQNTHFKAAWKNYTYLTTINTFTIYTRT